MSLIDRLLRRGGEHDPSTYAALVYVTSRLAPPSSSHRTTSGCTLRDDQARSLRLLVGDEAGKTQNLIARVAYEVARAELRAPRLVHLRVAEPIREVRRSDRPHLGIGGDEKVFPNVRPSGQWSAHDGLVHASRPTHIKDPNVSASASVSVARSVAATISWSAMTCSTSKRRGRSRTETPHGRPGTPSTSADSRRTAACGSPAPPGTRTTSSIAPLLFVAGIRASSRSSTTRAKDLAGTLANRTHRAAPRRARPASVRENDVVRSRRRFRPRLRCSSARSGTTTRHQQRELFVEATGPCAILGFDPRFSTAMRGDLAAYVVILQTDNNESPHGARSRSGHWSQDQQVAMVVDRAHHYRAQVVVESNAGGRFVHEQIAKKIPSAKAYATTATSKLAMVDGFAGELLNGRLTRREPRHTPGWR